MQTFTLKPEGYPKARNSGILRSAVLYLLTVPTAALMVVRGDFSVRGLATVFGTMLAMGLGFALFQWASIRRLRSAWRSFQIIIDGDKLTRSVEPGGSASIWRDLVTRIDEYADVGLVVRTSGRERAISIPPSLEGYAEARALIAAWRPITSHRRPYMPLYLNLTIGLAGFMLIWAILNVRSLPVVLAAGAVIIGGTLWAAIVLTRSRAATWLKVFQWAVVLLALFTVAQQARAATRVALARQVLGRWDGYLLAHPSVSGQALGLPQATLELMEDGSVRLQGVGGWSIKRFGISDDNRVLLDAFPATDLLVRDEALLLLSNEGRGLIFFRPDSAPQAARRFLTVDPQALYRSWVKFDTFSAAPQQVLTFSEDGTFAVSLTYLLNHANLGDARGTFKVEDGYIRTKVREGNAGDFRVNSGLRRDQPDHEFAILRLTKDELVIAPIWAGGSDGLIVYSRK